MGFPSAALFFGFNFHTDNPQGTAPLGKNGEARASQQPRVPVWSPAKDVCALALIEDEHGDLGPCKVITSGEEFTRVYSLAVTETVREVSNWDIGNSALAMPPSFRMRYHSALYLASERLGIPWVEPGWHLVIDSL